ncbi:hypothetical protein N7462_011632 [Penicillium macrosclerotiorum]|uniref:uncharacterized protein n=1 Tax=Penicillium macrosclerotiorum TaxID=303699 RepID=UPI002549766F|nr:uncharacterized protein N7462_011632 [Penicillium macrosclerotiorum]KAJ5662706.1 hypothetical protein N7462_011632 [Penicillium macrosclerotiorum]
MGNFVSASHDCLKQVCFDFFRRASDDSFRQIIRNLRGLRLSSEKKNFVQTTIPFLDYAVCNFLYHSNLAQAGDFSQQKFLREFADLFSDFKRIHTAIQGFANRQYGDDISILYLLADNGFHHLIPIELRGESYAWKPSGPMVCPMGAAFRRGDLATIQALLGFEMKSEACIVDNFAEPELVARLKDFLTESELHKTSEVKYSMSGLLLRFALESSRVNILRLLLLTNKVDFNANVGKNTVTPLLWAIHESKPEVVEFLLSEAKINVNGETPKKDYLKRHPLKAVFIKSQNRYNETHINRDAAEIYKEADRTILELLLRHEALNLDYQDEVGRNAAHWAALACDESAFSSLIERGVDIQHCDSDGRDPLSYAAEYGCNDVVKIILQRGKDLLFLLLETKKVNVNTGDDQLRPPLEWATQTGNPATVQVLLQNADVDVNSRNESGQTPLIIAILYRREDVVKMLLSSTRLEANLRDVDGRTALSWAVAPFNLRKDEIHSSPRSKGVINALFESQKVDPGVLDNWGHSPLWWAKAYDVMLTDLRSIRQLDKTFSESFAEWILSKHKSSTISLLPLSTNMVRHDMWQFIKGSESIKSISNVNMNNRCGRLSFTENEGFSFGYSGGSAAEDW